MIKEDIVFDCNDLPDAMGERSWITSNSKLKVLSSKQTKTFFINLVLNILQINH
jgi:hypothetical protein